MSSTIKRYDLHIDSYGDEFGQIDQRDDGFYVLHADHLASHAYDEEKERALFEDHMNNSGYSNRNLVRLRCGGDYLSEAIEKQWMVWKACAKSRAKAAGCDKC